MTKEIRRIETECDTVPDVDPAYLDPHGFGGLPFNEQFAQIVSHILMAGERNTVGGPNIQPPAVVQLKYLAEVPLIARVQEQPVFPGRRRGRRQRHGETAPYTGQFQRATQIVDVFGCRRGLLLCRLRWHLSGNPIQIGILIGAVSRAGGGQAGLQHDPVPAHHSGRSLGR